MIRGGGSFTWISNNVGPQIPVTSDNVPYLTAQDVHVSGVGDVRPLETVAPVSGAVPIHAWWWCSDSEDSDDDVLPVGLLSLWTDRRCVVHNWMTLDGRCLIVFQACCCPSRTVMWTELTQAVLPDVFPVASADVAAVPWPLPAVDVSVPQAI